MQLAAAHVSLQDIKANCVRQDFYVIKKSDADFACEINPTLKLRENIRGLVTFCFACKSDLWYIRK